MSSNPKWQRRALDRDEQKALDLEKQLTKHMERFGVPSFDLLIDLVQTYISRARERVKRDQATKEDLKILEKITNMK